MGPCDTGRSIYCDELVVFKIPVIIGVQNGQNLPPTKQKRLMRGRKGRVTVLVNYIEVDPPPHQPQKKKTKKAINCIIK